MHIALSLFYGLIVYLSALAYALIAEPNCFWRVLFCGPLIVSGSIAWLTFLDWFCWYVWRAIRAALVR